MWWRPKVIRWTVLSAAIASSITTILVTLMLLPAITDGPDAVHYLERTNCVLNNITYVDNLCPRSESPGGGNVLIDSDVPAGGPSGGDFSNLVYLEDWSTCKIILFNISNDLDINCHWYHPGSYETEQEAFIAVSENYRVGQKYDCVLDTVKNICYPDKKEVLIFALSVSSLLLLTIMIIVVFCYLRIFLDKK